jgi:hypothetical protein
VRRRLGGEDGQALLLALAFLLFFGLVIAAILAFAEASVMATTNLREQRAVAYAADGAMDGAIQLGRWNLAVGAYGASPCVSYSVTLNGKTATVTCDSVGNPLNQDRRVIFTASVDGVPRVRADVLYDGVTTPPAPVWVIKWTYLR